MLLICAPSAKILARMIEGKSFTFTVGGAAFTGILVAPFLTRLLEALSGWPLPVLPVIAAIAVAYAFGEGLGRLACVSFGCCYGRPLADLSPAARRLLGAWAFTFTGKTKKIAYESGLDGQKVVPVQAFSAVINSAAGLAGTVLFLCRSSARPSCSPWSSRRSGVSSPSFSGRTFAAMRRSRPTRR